MLGKDMDPSGASSPNHSEKAKELENDEVEQITPEQLDAILRKVDAESRTRKLTPLFSKLVTIIAVLFTVFQIYTAFFGALAPQVQRSVHLSFAMALAFLLYPMKRGSMNAKLNPLDYCLFASAVITSVYWLLFFKDIVYRVGNITTLDFVMGLVAILTVLEATRRVIGYPVLILAIVALFYCYFGAYFPGFFQHRGFSINRIVRHMYLSTEGVLGVPIGVVSTFVFLFLLFGEFLKRTGIGEFFNDFSNALTGRSIGGPAKVAVVSSALEGTMSGSSIANVAGSGSFTIPMMKKCGYSPEFAAAVEASASTGGQIMPPVMGAAAFLMAEFTGIPYWTIAVSAAIPAILYFTGIFISVHLESKKNNLKGLKDAEVKSVWSVVKSRGILFLPVIVISVTMGSGMTAMRAGLYGIVSAILCGSIFKETRLKLKDYIQIFEAAGRTAIGVAVVSASAGIVVGMVTLTGLGLKLGTGLVDLAGGNLIITLILAMISSLVLGMGVPTTANYVITSTIVAPALIQLGVPIIPAHLFVFYFGIIADITPPVCSAVFTAAAIAKSNAMKTGITATRIAIGAFIIPFMFVLSPQLVLVNTTFLGMCRIIPGALLGMYMLSASTNGWMRCKTYWFERILLFVGGILLIDAGIITDIIGIAIFLFEILFQGYRLKKGTATPVGIGG